jgi:hypothetical protein
MSEDRAVDGTPLWDGYTSSRDRDLRRHYGMKLAHYDQLLELQGGVCGMPGCTTGPKPGDPLQVDEDPVTRAIRGLLCRRHNRALDDRESEYMAHPPAAELGWTVPDKQWQTRAARNAGRAERHRQAREAAKVPPPPPTPSPTRLAIDRMEREHQEEYQRALAESAAWTGGPVKVELDPEPPPREEAPARRRGLLGRLFG